MAVYIEYISRRPGIPLEAFHAVAGPGQPAWAAQYADDKLILNVGRTWRLGGEPEYLAVWHTPGKLTGYEAIEPVAVELDRVETPVALVRAGLYAGIGREIL